MFFDDYYLLEYIQSSGTQYINTGYIDTQNTGYELKFLATSASNNDGFIGSLSGSVGHAMRYYSSKWTVRWASINNEYGSFSTNTFYTLQANYNNSKNVVANGTTIYSNLPNANTNLPSFIFAQNNASSAQYISKLRVYSCKITDGQTLVRHFVPAQRKSDNVIGLYDLVNDVFYTNAGSGTFIAGHIVDISANPVGSGSASLEMDGDKAVITAVANQGYEFVDWTLDGYTQLEYIESTGTQYIDTGFIPDSNTKVDAVLLTTNQWSGTIYFGSGNSYNSNNIELYGTSNGNNKLEVHYSGYYDLVLPYDVSNKKFRFVQDKNQIYVFVNDEQVGQYAFNTKTFVCPYTMTILAIHRSNIDVTDYPVRCYSFKIYDNGTLVRDFIPVLRSSDCQVGLLDLVNMKFYGNSGTGEFIAGGYYE